MSASNPSTPPVESQPLLVQLSTVHPRHDTRIREKICRSLSEAFEDSVHLVVADGAGDEIAGNLTIHDLGKPRGGRVGRFLVGSIRAWRSLRNLDAEVVHCHDPELLPLAFLLKGRGLRVIYDVHEDYPRVIRTRSWIPRPLRAIAGVLMTWLESLASRWLDQVVVVTPQIAVRFPDDKTTLIQNFPRMDEFDISDEARPATVGNRFLYVGAITERRGVRTMIKAVESCQRSAGLILAGSFRPRRLQAECERMAGWDRVHFAGWVDRSTLQELTRTVCAGLVVFHESPNQPESQPNKLFEYMAAGLPVIASGFPYWRELLAEHRCCLFVQPEDPEALAKAMDWIVEHPDSATRMGSRGRMSVQSRFNWSQEEAKLLALYRSVIPRPDIGEVGASGTRAAT